ncbi:DUF6980 family protein [Desulfovibrio psychrotolerans]|uniref:DUF6980 family protein n=1 Tax=Desulfovibrio psychrotolerans TaxID=415242 RepID=UPI00157AE382|nr:hypothetical protein [Desulfovibrio psychrotolerans]
MKDVRINLSYDEIFREYYIKLRGTNARQGILYCPWCGEKLPRSVRDVYYQIIEKECGENFDIRTDSIPERVSKPNWWLDLDEDIEKLIDKYEREL